MKTFISLVLVSILSVVVLTVASTDAQPRADQQDIDDAIERGLEWLASQQNVDGSWGMFSFVGQTGLVVLGMETQATNSGQDPLDPGYMYYGEVQSGLDYIFEWAQITPIGPQPAGDPDTDGDGIGVYFEYSDRTYETAIAMAAIAASTHPEAVVDVPGSVVDGWTYAEVLGDVVDYLAYGQVDSEPCRGGWGYEENEIWGDNSTTGYVVLALAHAEGWGLTVPTFVKTELELWIYYIQNDVDGDPEDGGSGYSDPGEMVNILKTGNLLLEMAFVGDESTTQRVTDAIDYLVRHWDDPNDDPGWKGQEDPLTPPFEPPADYQATFTTMKGLVALGVEVIDSIDWYDDFSDVLVAQQNPAPDGSWPPSLWDGGDGILSTAWAVLTLQKAAPPIGPQCPAPQAIARGLEWLALQQSGDGSWGMGSNVGHTGLIVLSMETQATNSDEDPLDPGYMYYNEIRGGLDYIFAFAQILPIGPQPAGDPDSDGDGIGVYFEYDARLYETAVALAAIAASTHPEAVVNVPGSEVDGWTYAEVLQDVVDYIAYGQVETEPWRGGWGYEENETLADNSTTGYVILGLAHAETWGLTVPAFVKTELELWIDYIQNDVDGDPEDGGSGYSDPTDWVNVLKTGSLLLEMVYVGDDTTSQRVTDALDYLVRHWDDPDDDPGWKGQEDPLTPPFMPPANYQSTFTMMTGLEILEVADVDTIDWYADFCRVLVTQQTPVPSGSWPPTQWDYGDSLLSTAWAVLTLQKTVPDLQAPPPPPFCGDYIWQEENPCEYCGHDAYHETGWTEMNHDCWVDLLDLMLFEEAFYDYDISADYDGDGEVGPSDYAKFVISYNMGGPVEPCEPCSVFTVDCRGRIRVNFSPNPEEDVDRIDLEPFELAKAYVVTELCPGIGGASACLYVTPNITVDYVAFPSEFVLDGGTFPILPPHMGEGPLQIMEVDFWIENDQPGMLTLGGCEGNPMLWAQRHPLSYMNFMFIAAGGINTDARPDSLGCPSSVDPPPYTQLEPVSILTWPNPAQTTVSLAFRLDPGPSSRVEVFDAGGRMVRRLHEGALTPGTVLIWDGKSESGRLVPSGIYFVRLASEGVTEKSRLVILR